MALFLVICILWENTFLERYKDKIDLDIPTENLYVNKMINERNIVPQFCHECQLFNFCTMSPIFKEYQGAFKIMYWLISIRFQFATLNNVQKFFEYLKANCYHLIYMIYPKFCCLLLALTSFLQSIFHCFLNNDTLSLLSMFYQVILKHQHRKIVDTTHLTIPSMREKYCISGKQFFVIVLESVKLLL